jgi:transcriptional regulator with XRE-family HTH domain
LQDSFPKPVPGSVLRKLRDEQGIKQGELARALGIKRNALYNWEKSESLDVKRTGRYLRALWELTDRDVAP